MTYPNSNPNTPRSPRFPGIHKTRHLAYVIATKHGRHVCAGLAKYVIYLDLTLAHTGPQDGGAGRAADIPGGHEVGEHAHVPEEITTKRSSCGEALRQNAEGAEKAHRFAEIPFLDSNVEVSRECRVLAPPPAGAKAGTRPREETARTGLRWRERFANAK